MNSIWTLSIIVFFFACNPKMTANATDTNTMLTVYMTSDYCGGANPSDEILDDLKTPRLLKSKSIFIKVGEEKIVEVNTDKNGVAIVDMEAGTYGIFLQGKHSYKVAANADEYCKEWKETPNGVLTLSENQMEAKVTLHNSCNLCLPARY